MPTVDIPGRGIAEFPDSMSPDEIKGVIREKFFQQAAPAVPELQPVAVESAPVVQPNAAPAPDQLPGPPIGTEQNPRATLRELIGTVFSAPAKAVQMGANVTGGLLTGDLGQNPEAYKPTDADVQTALVSPETATTALRGLFGPLGFLSKGQTKGLGGILEGIISGTGDVASGFTTPENLALTPLGFGGKASQRILAGIFEGQAILGTKDQWKAFNEAKTASEKTRIGVGMGLGLALPAAAFAATFKAKGKAPTEGEIVELSPSEVSEIAQEPQMRGGEPLETQIQTPQTAAAEAAVLAEPPRNRNTPVELEGGSAIAQGDLDALTRSNAERLGLPTEGLAPEMPRAPVEAIAPETVATEAAPVRAAAPEGDTAPVAKGTEPQLISTAYMDVDGMVKLPPDIMPMIGHEGVSEFHGGKAPAETARGFWGIAKEGEQPRFLTREEGYDIAEARGEVPPGVTDPAMRRLKSENFQATGEPLYRASNEPTRPAQAASEIVGREDAPTAQPPVESNVAGAEVAPLSEAATTSVGPGAASAAEPLASYELRRFGKRFQEDQAIDPAIREQTGNRYYEPIPNRVTVADAVEIIRNRGTDESVRLVRDESFPMEPRVRVTMGEALIKELNEVHQQAKAAGNEPHANEFLQQAVDTAEFLSEYGTTLGQGVQAFAIWNKLTPEGRLIEAQRIMKKSGGELTPEQAKRIKELNAEIEKAPEGFQKDQKTQDLLSFMADLKGARASDIPTALWYSNILSGFTTQLVNTIDTGLNVLAETGAMAAANPKAVPNLLAGLYQGMIKGGFEAASVLKTGRSISGDKLTQQRILERTRFGEKGGVPMAATTPVSRFMKAAFESKVAKPLNLWKYPLRAMLASDTVFFNSMKEARARYLARGIAKKEGLSGDALYKRVENELNQSPATLDAALKQAQDEGLTGLDQRRRVNEIVEQGRDEGLMGDANEAAQIATYNHEPSGVLGLVAHNIANITEGFPLGKAIVPFTRIVANVANRGLNYTPWGYKRLFFGEWGGSKFASEPPKGDAFKSQLVKATLGTTAMATLAALDANDTIQVTAKGPDNPDESKQLQNAGWKPYTVKVGDTYYSYQYTPLNLGFAMIGHYRDAIRYNKLSEKDAATRLAYGMLKSGSTIFDMSFLSGVSDFVGTIQGATSSTKGAGRIFARTASSVVIPNLVKQTDKLFDPTIYQSDTITQALIRETPIARSTLLKPMLNVLGEPIKASQNRFFSFDTNDPVWKLIVEKQAFVPVPSKTRKVGDRPITSDEYYRLIKESGPMIHNYIESNLGRFQKMTGEDVQKAVRKESERARNEVISSF